jgi:hypothetical protein
MRYLLLALPVCLFAALGHAADHAHHHNHAHGSSLPAHQHGSAELDAALDGNLLEFELRSPAMNLLGFEYRARSPRDQQVLAAARERLQQADRLITLPAQGSCELEAVTLQSPLFEQATADAEHNDIQAHYRYRCSQPEALDEFSLRGLFEAFPGIEALRVQLLGPQGQTGSQISARQPQVRF